MSAKQTNAISHTQAYGDLLQDLKQKIQTAQVKAALAVNSQLIHMYWELGKDIVQQQAEHQWGSDFINQLSKDLCREFPEIKGFSRTNLYYIKQWFLFYSDAFEKVPQLVGQISKAGYVEQLTAQIPWGHNRLIVEKIKNIEAALWYIQQTIEHGWSRNVLGMQIKSNLYGRQAKPKLDKVTNFSNVLPKPQSDLLHDTLKDPYIFDFLSLGEEASEREIEKSLTDHIREFLLELGSGFAFVGTQYHLEVAGDDFYIDMLFYHLTLHSYVVIELKTTKFKPEYAGKLNFYLAVVDDLVKAPEDNPTIGLLLCKDKNKLVAEYALRDMNKPMGVSEYKLAEEIIDNLQETLPSIDAIEKELNEHGNT